MLNIIQNLKMISFSQLKNVYSTSIGNNADIYYTNLDANGRIREAEQDFYNYTKSFFQIPDAKMYVWIVDNKYVSAVRLEPFDDGMLLSGLETAPERQGSGYATALISAVINDCVSNTKRLYSHVAKDNAASLAVHRKAGFSIISENARYLDGSADYKCYTLLKELV